MLQKIMMEKLISHNFEVEYDMKILLNTCAWRALLSEYENYVYFPLLMTIFNVCISIFFLYIAFAKWLSLENASSLHLHCYCLQRWLRW